MLVLGQKRSIRWSNYKKIKCLFFTSITISSHLDKNPGGAYRKTSIGFLEKGVIKNTPFFPIGISIIHRVVHRESYTGNRGRADLLLPMLASGSPYIAYRGRKVGVRRGAFLLPLAAGGYVFWGVFCFLGPVSLVKLGFEIFV